MGPVGSKEGGAGPPLSTGGCYIGSVEYCVTSKKSRDCPLPFGVQIKAKLRHCFTAA